MNPPDDSVESLAAGEKLAEKAKSWLGDGSAGLFSFSLAGAAAECVPVAASASAWRWVSDGELGGMSKDAENPAKLKAAAHRI